jgi:AcrR family transcriptional regulator
MDKKSQRLGRQDWILAGFRALVVGGARALKVEPVARAIGASKGSFYWHFAGPAEWRDAMLDHWRQAALSDVISTLSREPDGRARLRGLIRIASTVGRESEHGGVMAEPALRAWAQVDQLVALAVREVDEARLEFLGICLEDARLPKGQADIAARLIYALHLGQQALGQPPEQDIADLEKLIDLLLP